MRQLLTLSLHQGDSWLGNSCLSNLKWQAYRTTSRIFFPHRCQTSGPRLHAPLCQIRSPIQSLQIFLAWKRFSKTKCFARHLVMKSLTWSKFQPSPALYAPRPPLHAFVSLRQIYSAQPNHPVAQHCELVIFMFSLSLQQPGRRRT